WPSLAVSLFHTTRGHGRRRPLGSRCRRYEPSPTPSSSSLPRHVAVPLLGRRPGLPRITSRSSRSLDPELLLCFFPTRPKPTSSPLDPEWIVKLPEAPSRSARPHPLAPPRRSSAAGRTNCREHRRRWAPDVQIRSLSLPRRRPCRRRLHRFLTRTTPLQFVSSASLCPIWSPLTASIGWVTAAQAQLPSPASPAPRVPAGPM
uniref:Uncharacterized protein n=1 Tax=Aegilops tauschii subsp. strangulata TaxID=200361 RepID=A0A453G1P9_AEGTS